MPTHTVSRGPRPPLQMRQSGMGRLNPSPDSKRKGPRTPKSRDLGPKARFRNSVGPDSTVDNTMGRISSAIFKKLVAPSAWRTPCEWRCGSTSDFFEPSRFFPLIFVGSIHLEWKTFSHRGGSNCRIVIWRAWRTSYVVVSFHALLCAEISRPARTPAKECVGSHGRIAGEARTRPLPLVFFHPWPEGANRNFLSPTSSGWEKYLLSCIARKLIW